MNALTNNYQACTIYNIEPETPAGPYLVVQEASDPEDPHMKAAIFLLQRDGTWINEIARGELPEDDRWNVVFEKLEEIMGLFERSTEPPDVLRIPLTEAHIAQHIEHLKAAGGAEGLRRRFLARYLDWKSRQGVSTLQK